MADLTPLKQAVIDGNAKKVLEITKEALEENLDPQALLTDHMIPGMLEVGELMAEGEYFIPEVLRSAKAMNGALELVEPLLADGDRETAGDVIIGSVKGDIHDIGKNLVAMLLKGNGFIVQDLGVDVPMEKFVEAAQAIDGPVIVGMSALITPVLDEMEAVIKAIDDAGIRDRVRIMVGGAPVTEEYADSIGADGMAADAAAAVTLAKKLLA
jgi:5-methyltetrahydrofolate--homocysteine methyltransferase